MLVRDRTLRALYLLTFVLLVYYVCVVEILGKVGYTLAYVPQHTGSLTHGMLW